MKAFYIKKMILQFCNVIICVTTIFILSNCEDFVSVDRLETQILAEQIFEDDAMANSAIVGLYKSFKSGIPSFLSYNSSVYSDEVIPFLNGASNTYYTNSLQPNDTSLPWSPFYIVIYGANNAIEKLNVSSTISQSKRSQYIAEAKFMRAMCHFYLVNFFGDIPLVLTSDVNTNKLISRTPVAKVYDQIIADLIDAKNNLGDDYVHSANERVRANKWVASAMLARAYLFVKDYPKAEAEANAIISSGKYALLNSPVGIWSKNNTEAILQLANNVSENNSTAFSYIYTNAPVAVLTSSLLDEFESGDLRKNTWIQTSTYAGQSVSIPYKMTTTASNPLEYYTLIRLAEIHLIRAEARAMREDFGGCADDINLIRLQHGGLTTPLLDPVSTETGINMVLDERQVELFTEGGHRFFDLKRTGRIDAAMLEAKPDYWKSTASLYPIPLTERQRNPNLNPQNPGYE